MGALSAHSPVSGILLRLHQTRISRLVRRVPIAKSVATYWWLSVQRRRAQGALDALERELESMQISEPESSRDLDEFTDSDLSRAFAAEMKSLCRSAKFFDHGYERVYGPIIDKLRHGSPTVLEIGLGVNDPSVPSGMPEDYLPGESLRGLRMLLPHARLHGADVDRRVLDENEYFTPHHVDQRNLESVYRLGEHVGKDIDLVIDDGLHTPEANANSIAGLFLSLSTRGVIVIEDILPEFMPVWEALRFPSAVQYRLISPEALGQDSGSGVLVVWR